MASNLLHLCLTGTRSVRGTRCPARQQMRGLAMIRSHSTSGTFAGITAALLTLVFPLPAMAKRIAVDFEPAAFAREGSGWVFSTGILYDQAAVDAGANRSMLFSLAGSYDPDQSDPSNPDVNFAFDQNAALRVGGSDYSFVCMFANLSFSFSQSGSCGTAGDPSFSLLPIDGLSVINTTNAATGGSVSSFEGFSVGIPAEGQPDFAAPYDINAAVPTMRLWWNDLAASYDEFGNPVGPSYSVQTFIYFLGGGNFDLDVRYGIEGDTGFPGVERAFVVDGQTIFSSTNPALEDGDYFYRFRGGLLQGGGTPPPPTNVPEPGSLALMLAGLTGLAAVLRRKRCRPISAP